MEYFKISDLHPSLSRIVLGCDHYGETTPKEVAFQILDYYYEAGGRTLDTAHCYGEGSSERVVGEWVKSNGVRDSVFVATKGGRFDLNINSNPAKEFEESCERLGFIPNAWFLHRDCPSKKVDDVIDSVHTAVDRKTVLFGLSNWDVKRMSQLDFVPTLAEVQYSYAVSTPQSWSDPTIICMNEEQRKWYVEKKVPVFCFASQAQGYFSNILAGKPLSERCENRFSSPENEKRSERVKVLAEKYGVSPSTIVVSYLYSQSDLLACPIVAASKLWQIEDTLSNTSFKLSYEDICFLNGKE